MKMKRFFSLFFVCALLLSLSPTVSARDGFSVDAKAALLVDVGSGETLYAKNIHERNYPASITKIMTALLVLEAVDAGELRLDQEVTARESALEGLARDGSTANIKAGETMTVEDLLNCLLIVSANEASHILAEAVCGDVGAFVARMNERAARLGCSDTHFVNPSGLHSDQHYSSAWDVYLITREALKNKTFAEIVGNKAHTVPATNLSKERSLHSTNYLISTWRTGWPGYYYKSARGVKTGSTPEAGYCLAASAERGGRELISVVLGAERVTREDGVVETRSFSETIRLFEHGFHDFKSMELVDTTEYIREIPVNLSSEVNYVVVHPGENLTRMVPAHLTRGDLTRTVELNTESVDAPIAEGDVLGTMTLSYDGVEYGTVPLIALNDVSASWLLTKEREVELFFAQRWVKYAAISVVALVVVILALILVSRSRGRRYRGSRGRSNGYSRARYRGRGRR